jgi:hypothetical protein
MRKGISGREMSKKPRFVILDVGDGRKAAVDPSKVGIVWDAIVFPPTPPKVWIGGAEDGLLVLGTVDEVLAKLGAEPTPTTKRSRARLLQSDADILREVLGAEPAPVTKRSTVWVLRASERFVICSIHASKEGALARQALYSFATEIVKMEVLT